MKVLVTGALGYIGEIMVRILHGAGHAVTGMDTGFYAATLLYDDGPSPVSTVRKDTRAVTAGDLRGFDAVVHLGELSNDPLGQMNPEITHTINHRASVRLARLCKEAGVPRFVYSSSCSVYGAGSGDVKDERSSVNPQTAYAVCKARVEEDVSALADTRFSPVFLRNATVYGCSPRMRFDLVLNNLSGLAWTTREIRMTSDGTPWRPLIHVADVCKAFRCAIEAPRQTVHNQVLNVGDSKANYRVREVAEIVAETFQGCVTSFGTGDKDNRSYRVDFSKIRAVLPAFSCDHDARSGARELRDRFAAIGMTREVFEHRAFTRLKQLQYLLDTRQIDSDLCWRHAGGETAAG